MPETIVSAVLAVSPGQLSDAELWKIAQSVNLDDETIELVHFVRSLRSRNLPAGLTEAIAEVDRKACELLRLRLAGD